MKLAKITIKGTGQLNGHVIINKTFEIERTMANAFVGPKRQQVIEDFLKQHYPGVKIDVKRIGINIVDIDTKIQSTPSKVVPSNNDIKKDKESNEINTKNANLNSTSILKEKKDEIELEYFKKQKKADFKAQQNLNRQKTREENLQIIKSNIDNGENKILGYSKIIWAYLDTWWKKAIFIYLILLIINEISSFLGVTK